MANRAYLYSANKELTVLRDLSEYTSEVPLVYKILLGVNTELANSEIWKNEPPIAIKADFQGGLNRLYQFFDYLETQEGIDKLKISELRLETQHFFEKNEDRILDLFFMEAAEVYDLAAFEDYTIEKENEYTYLTILSISASIDKILIQRPDNLFDYIERYPWLQEIKEDITILSPYWRRVTYFSFNKTGNFVQQDF